MAAALDADDIEVVLFDSYGTLLDTGTASEALEGIVDDPEAVATRWRRNALFYRLSRRMPRGLTPGLNPTLRDMNH